MRGFVIYLIVIGLIATTLMTTVSAMAGDVTCTLGSYGAIVAGC